MESAFVNQFKSVRPIVIGYGTSGVPGGYGGGSAFANALNGVIGPRVTIAPKVVLNLGKGNDTGSSSPRKSSGPNSPGNGGGGNGKGGRPFKKYANSDGYYPPSELKTSSLSFSSGIKSGTLINPFEVSKCEVSASLFTLGGSFLPVDLKDNICSNLITADIYYSLLSKIQQDVNYRIERDFTPGEFLLYIQRVSSALQLYYSVDSILAYSSLPKNSNVGMSYLRTLLNAEILSKHESLKRALLRSSIPPKLLAFIAYMYQNFRFSDLNESAIFKLEFRCIFHSTSNQSLSPSYYDVIIDELREMSQISNLIMKGRPDYEVTQLPASCAQPIFDPNFKTFWYNSNSAIVRDGKVYNSRAVDSHDQEFYYATFTKDDVDGIFYACSSVYSNLTMGSEPGLWVPYSDLKVLDKCLNLKQKSSVLCYDSLTNTMISPCDERTSSQSGLFHSHYYDRDPEIMNFRDDLNTNPSAQKVQVHNIMNTTYAVSESVNYLFEER